MKTYDTYKDSGIEWIGQIPEHWEVKKLKYLAQIGNGKDHKGVWDENGKFSIIGTGGEFGKANKYLFDKPSVILGRKGTIDKPMYVDKPFWAVDTAYYTISNNNTNTKYLFYLSNTINFGFYKYGSTVPSMNQEQLKEIYFSTPPTKSEQTAIANYLDHKTAEIDQLIADKKRLVVLYQEEKTAIINQAVTKGINPDARRKDSGIEWLGAIPEHWEVLPIKYTLATPITDGPHETPKLVPDGIPFISAEAIKNDRIDFNKKRGFITKEEHERFSTKYKPQIGDVYMIKSGATTGNLAIVETDKEFNIWSPLAAMRPKKDKLESKFLFFFMKSKSFFSAIEIGWNYGTQQNIGMKVLENIRMVLPKVNEQTAIVQHIEKESARIDAKINQAERYIKLLTEYRTALISEVVTGKVKVIDN